MIDLLWCDGTWSKPHARSPVSQALRRSLNPALVRFRYVDYPATFGPATGIGDVALDESVSVGAVAMEQAVTDSPNVCAVGGYSQGAMVAVRYAREILPRRLDHEVIAVAALGNPHQLAHHGREGIAGGLHVPRPYFSLYAPDDPIADLPQGNPMRTLADLGDWMSIRSLEADRRWAADVLDDITQERMQAWWQPWRWNDLASAGRYVLNYLGTNHDDDYITKGYVDRLARMIEGVA